MQPKRLVYSFGVAILLSGLGTAQSINSGTVTGTVSDP